MGEFIKPVDPREIELTPAQQIIATKVMDEFRYSNSVSSIEDITTLALFLRSKGLSADTIQPVTNIGGKLLQAMQEQGKKSPVNQALLALCADESNPLTSAEPYSLSAVLGESNIIKEFEEYALHIFPQRVVELWREREDYSFYDHTGELNRVVLEGEDVSTIQVSNGDDLGWVLFGNYDSYLHGEITTSYELVQKYINQARGLQEES